MSEWPVDLQMYTVVEIVQDLVKRVIGILYPMQHMHVANVHVHIDLHSDVLHCNDWDSILRLLMRATGGRAYDLLPMCFQKMHSL